MHLFLLRKIKLLDQVFMRYFLVFSLLVPLLLISACSTPQKTETQQTSKQRINISFQPLSAWIERRFAGSTEYHLKQNEGRNILIANSKHSASLLYKKIRIDLNQTPYLNWQWLVEQTYSSNTQESTKQGDDFPARIYIAIKPRLGQIKPRALTYVWASHAEQFSHWQNPFAKSVNVFAIESGDRLVGKWLAEKRNLKDDLSALFGQEIDTIEGIGVMTDSDNSKTVGKAAYANVFFSKD